jgi:cellulose synthase/poly-beta-1,6-N-acetylglucosamine synthase-like glycosyltransferase
MDSAAWIFWVSFGLVLYTYVLYPAVLAAAGAFARAPRRTAGTPAASAGSGWPAVSLVIPAFNEEDHLPGKLCNLAELDYPGDRLETIFVSDGSTDDTDRILARARLPHFRLLRVPERRGKPNALNLAVRAARNDILVFSDAATLFARDAVKKLVGRFDDPRVGVVCGTLEFLHTPDSKHTEGLYWRYESALRRAEARIGAALNGSGAIYALRHACYRELPTDAILDDLLVPMTARKLGFRIEYEPEARAREPVAASPAGDFIRRARLAAGGFRSLPRLAACAATSPLALCAFVSHKLLRWLVPIFLLAALGSSIFLASRPFYRFALLAQCAFYLWALAGMMFRRQLRCYRFALAGYFVVAMNAALLVGFARSLAGSQPVTWTRVD